MFVDGKVEERLQSTVLITGKSERRKQNYRQTLCEYIYEVMYMRVFGHVAPWRTLIYEKVYTSFTFTRIY